MSIEDLVSPIPDHVVKLTTKRGFVDKFWELVKDMGITHEAAYELLEDEYRAYFGKNKYKNFSSFRRRRDDLPPLYNDEREYFYVFYDCNRDVAYLGKSTNPVRLFKDLQRGNPDMIITHLTRNFDYEMLMEWASDYKSIDGTYKLPPLVFASICGHGKLDKGYSLTKAARDLTKENRGKPGVYVYSDEGGKVLYVGVASDLHIRPRSSFSSRFKYMQEPVFLELYPCNRADAAVLEMYLICRDKPIYNRAAISNDPLTLKLDNIPTPTKRVRANPG